MSASAASCVSAVAKEKMRRKRFKHHTDIFCDMFCGWRLLSCSDRMIEMGSGVYDLDFLSRRYSKDGKEISDLPIGEEVSIWWREDMKRESISLDMIDQASMVVEIEIKPLEGKRKTRDVYPINSYGDFYACSISCTALLKSGADSYESSKLDYEEWPYPLRGKVYPCVISSVANLATGDQMGHLINEKTSFKKHCELENEHSIP